MSTPATPLSQIATDTAAVVSILKSSAAQLSTEAKADLTAALAAAHQEFTDIKGSGASIWSAILAAIGKAPAPPVTPPAAARK